MALKGEGRMYRSPSGSSLECCLTKCLSIAFLVLLLLLFCRCFVYVSTTSNRFSIPGKAAKKTGPSPAPRTGGRISSHYVWSSKPEQQDWMHGVSGAHYALYMQLIKQCKQSSPQPQQTRTRSPVASETRRSLFQI